MCHRGSSGVGAEDYRVRRTAGRGIMTRRRPHFARRAPTQIFLEKYNRSAMGNARQLQCKTLRGLKKRRQRENNGAQWENQCEAPLGRQQKPADEQRRATVARIQD
jgi:hypothetical protein